jgi:hypothetical protein
MRTWLTLLLLGFVVLAFGWGTRRVPAIVVQNDSGVAIDGVVLLVGDARATLPGAAAGGQSVPLRQEGRAALEVRFADGFRGRFDVGWFNPAARGDLRVVVVSRDSVRVERTGVDD